MYGVYFHLAQCKKVKLTKQFAHARSYALAPPSPAIDELTSAPTGHVWGRAVAVACFRLARSDAEGWADRELKRLAIHENGCQNLLRS